MKVFLLILLASIVDVVMSGIIIGNGHVIIGAGTFGNLNAAYVGGILGLPGADGKRKWFVSIRNGNLPNGDAGIYGAESYTFEGWGAGVTAAGAFTTTCDMRYVPTGMSLINFTGVNGGSTATSHVTCGSDDMTVYHDFIPSIASDLMQVDVTISNKGDTDFEEVHYRRVMDWEIDPTPGKEYVTHIGVGTTKSLYYSNDNGSCDPNPSSRCIPIRFKNVDFTDSGRSDHGSMFQFNFGRLKAGESFTFQIYYGTSLGEDAAMAALVSVGAELVSLAQQRDSLLGRDPYTYILAFSGVQGLPITSSAPSVSSAPSATLSVAPTSAPSVSSAPTFSPTDVPLFKWFLVDAEKDVDVYELVENDSYIFFCNIGTFLLTIRLETASNIKQVVFTWRGSNGVVHTNTEINAPFYMNRNNKTDAFPVRYLRFEGPKTVKATMKDSSGTVIATSTTQFYLVL